MSEKEFVDDLESLVLDVYTIGYSDKGESQIILLKDNSTNKILLSFVIDCYSKSDKHVTSEILKLNDVIDLNYFIWTHPDEDHSIGISEIINSFCTKNTNFILPEGVAGNENDFIDYNEEVKETFNLINSHNQNRSYYVNTATVIKGQHQQIFEKIYIDKNTPRELSFKVLALAPISAIVRRRWETGEVKKKNDLSIATLFIVGGNKLLFGGDIENQSIRLIPNFYFEDLTYIKTPHHTSKSSNVLIDIIDSNNNGAKVPIANTTTYKDNNLPDPDLIQDYLKHVDIFSSTGSGSNGYGYIKTSFNIHKNEINIELNGDAINYVQH